MGGGLRQQVGGGDVCESLLGQARSVIPPPSVAARQLPHPFGTGEPFVPKVSQFREISTQNTVWRHKLPNLPFALKISPHFVISPEIVLDNGERVWYHTFVR